jgi:hypothetical protein
MNKRLVAVLVPLMLFAFAATSAQAASGGAELSAKGPANASVSIEIWPGKGLFGYVESPRKRCEARRLVRVFKKLPGGKLRAIGRDRTGPTGNGFMWSLKSRKATSGTIVASAPRTGGCADTAARKRVLPRSGDTYPPCPSKADICRLERIRITDRVSFEDKLCPIWGKSGRGECKSELAGGRVPICCFERGSLDWHITERGRDLLMYFWDLTEIGKPPIKGPTIFGSVADDRSAKFFVDSFAVPGFDPGGPTAYWYTPQNRAAEPGTPGGPLYFNWDAGWDNHFDLYLHGYLYRKQNQD